MTYQLICGDCYEWLLTQSNNSIDLIFTSPPYENARSYNIGFKLKGEEYVAWMLKIWKEMDRVCKGLVAVVIDSPTKNGQYGAAPLMLGANLHRNGIQLRHPIVFHRHGVAGSGGKEWLRNDWEFILCSSKGKLPYSNPLATAQPPKYAVGGNMSNRTKNGDRVKSKPFKQPALANPGNVLKFKVGGGHMGNKLAHLNEAPFPLSLCDFFIKSFCPPNGTVLDPFCGSGSSGESAIRNGRNYIGIDIRQNQIDICEERLSVI